MILQEKKNGQLGDEEEDDSLEFEPIIVRSEKKSFTGPCQQCGKEWDTDGPSVSRLYLELTETYVTLCHDHEIEFTEKLVKRYVKRLKKGKEKLLLDKDPILDDDEDLEEIDVLPVLGMAELIDEGGE